MSRKRHGLVILLLAVTTRGYSVQQTIDALLTRYDQTQKSMQTKYIKSETIREYRDSWSGTSDWDMKRTELYTDGSRFDLSMSGWTTIRDIDDRELSNSAHTQAIWDNNTWYEYKEKINKVYISKKDEMKNKYFPIGYTGARLEGFFSGNLKTVSSIFHEADQVKLYNEKEYINGIQCYVLETTTVHGKHKIWLDPEHGYNICQAEVIKGKDDLFNNEPVSVPYPDWSKLNIKQPEGKPPLPTSPRAEIVFTMRNVKFQEINGIWIPISADWESKTTHENGRTMTQLFNHKRKDIDLSPDFEAVQAFVPKIRNGTRVVLIDGTPDSRYVWQDGKPTPLFVEFLSLVGKPLSDLKGLNIDLSSADTKDKMILVCFFDMEQRPSRNCIMRLAKKAQELKTKDLVVVAVQASKIDENKLNKWIKKYDIPFNIGMIQDDIEKTRFDWGVRSLPWLILTNKQHIVCAEGFALHELDGKISAATQK